MRVDSLHPKSLTPSSEWKPENIERKVQLTIAIIKRLWLQFIMCCEVKKSIGWYLLQQSLIISCVDKLKRVE